jgi:hypothetical protein
MKMPCRVASQWTAEPPRQRFRTGVSLHSHTLHSRERLDFIYRLARGVPVLKAALSRGERHYQATHGRPMDLSRAWWTPPLGPYDAFQLERDQIRGLGLDALVSLTDHDDIEAPVSLQLLEQCRETPISVEWTVPFGASFFHLGVHNLSPAEARMFHHEMESYRKSPCEEPLGDILPELAARPRTLLVFNHPLWDEAGIGAERHAESARAFLRRFGPYLHAMELNGFRPWQENRRVVAFAAAAGKPLISGGDRHTTEPNSMLNLTNAANFTEFAEEVRAGWSQVLILHHYRQSYGLRVLHNLMEVVRTQPHHALGWTQWSDRAFYACDDGVVRSLTELFGTRVPLPVRVFLGALRVASAPQVQWILNGAFQPGEEVIL